MFKTVILPAMKAGGAKDMVMSRAGLGSNGNQYFSTSLFDKWSELDARGSFQKTLGPELYKQYLTKTTSCVRESTTMVLQFLPDISYRLP